MRDRIGVRGDTKGMPDDERQGRSKRVTKEGYQMDKSERRQYRYVDDKGMDRSERMRGGKCQMMRKMTK
jgi:hypothetical protein